MTVHFKTTGGVLRAGLINGAGEVYHADEKGNGEIYKGNFANGKLNDTEGVYITYTNNSYLYYSGTFIDNKMDGYMNVLSYSTTDPITDDEKKCSGNNYCYSNGVRYVYASENNIPLIGRKKTIIFSNGIEGATVSDTEQIMNISVAQGCLNGRKIFTDFCIFY